MSTTTSNSIIGCSSSLISHHTNSSLSNRSSQTPSPLTAVSSFTINNLSTDTSLDDITMSNSTIDSNILYNPFRINNQKPNSLQPLNNILTNTNPLSIFNHQKLMDPNNNEEQQILIKSLTNLNLLNQANFCSNPLMFNKTDSSIDLPSQQNNLLHQQCGICGKYPMVNGKTLIGCLHSFCQPCLIQSSINSISSTGSPIIACPICAQETLVPNGGIDALMPHYSNPLLLNNPNLNISYMSSSSSVSSSSSTSSSSSSPPNSTTNLAKSNRSSINQIPPIKTQDLNKSNYSYIMNNKQPAKSDLGSFLNNMDINDVSASDNNNNEQQMFKKRLQSQLQNRFVQIENEIQKTHTFYVQMLNERREYLIKEFHAVVQFVINQNQMKSKQRLHDLDKMGNDFESDDFLESDEMNGNELQSLINNHLMSIDFVSNFSAIQASIRNTFGYIRYNQNLSTSNSSTPTINETSNSNSQTNNVQNLQNSNNNIINSNSNSNNNSVGNVCYKPKPIGPSNSNSSSSTQSNLLSNSMINTNNNNYQTNIVNSNTDLLIEQFVNNLNNNGHLLGPGNNKPRSSTGSSNGNRSGSPVQNNVLSSFQFNSNLNGNNNSSNIASSNSSANTNLSKTTNSIISPKQGGSISSNNTTPTSWSSVVAASANRNLQSQTSSSGHNQQHQSVNSSIIISDSNMHIEENVNVQRLSNNSLSSASSSSSEHQNSNSESNESSNQLITGTSSAQSNLLPARSSLKRSKMIYNCKFGEFGVTDGQFTEPSGVAINANNDIIVADTNSHRIQIFDRDGRFKFKFGECGKREGQLLYPNRVSVVKHTGDIVVTERSPTHQIQVYNQYGQFLRKFGANILQHPRGVCVDSKGRIIVVECKVMRVIIFDLMGNVLHKFNCSKYLEFPNGCCCSNDREEIFISDNRAHCIKVFNYEGQYLRQIGGEGITNYPIGVGINSNGEVLVADNHNNFNLTVFTQDGQLINALESKVKHAQCFDVGLMDDGSIVLASKDYRIYVYKYNSSDNSALLTANQSLSLIQNGNNSIFQNQQQISLSNSNNNKNNLISSITDFNF